MHCVSCVCGRGKEEAGRACMQGGEGGGGEVSKFSKMLLDPESRRILAVFFSEWKCK